MLQCALPMDIYRRLLNYVKPYKLRFLSAVLCMIGFALTNSMVSILPYITINGLNNKNMVILPLGKRLPDFIPEQFPTYWIPIIIVVLMSIRSILEYISNYQMANIGIRAVRNVRDDVYEHLVHLSNDFYSKGRTGDFLSRIINDVGSIQGAITDVIVDIIKQPMTILFTLPWIFFWGGKYAIYGVCTFPLVAIPIILLGRNLRRTTKKMQERSADITAFIGETLTGVTIVKSFNREEEEINRFKRLNKTVTDFFKKTVRITLIQRPLVEFLGAVGAAVAVWFGLKHLSAENFTSFVISLFLLFEPIKKLSKVNSTIQQSIAAGSRIFEILDSVPTIRNRENAIDFKEPVREISYEDVRFSYDGSREVLHGISFRVNRGEVVALVGASGSGKTTLSSLLMRFYDPTTGAIRMNGKDIRDLDLVSLRNKIGIVTQETILFNGTVRENIAYSNLNLTLEEVKAAAKTAYADHFIETLSEGYDTPLGERGLKLSGGQRQRLAIARALAKNPEVLVFDEATSHLDTESEREVQNALENAMQGRTVLVIAHRLSTIQRADRILVFHEGKIIQQGTNDSLLKEGGVYKKLYDLQFNL
jgi:ATP-binding cassette, subfamily B, bacterial MsbA